MPALGFTCISKSMKENGKFRTMTVKTFESLPSEERMRRLRSMSVDNLYNVHKIILWCIEKGIALYRLSSDLIPLANYFPKWHWWEDRDILNMCSKIKEIVDEGKIRISMHPDQFCVLNSDRPEVVEKSIKILEHHNCNHENDNLTFLIERIRNTWKGERPKIHLSSGRSCPTDRHHADFIDYEDYKRTIELVKNDFDIMMECKEKDLAVLEIMKKSQI